ncbi:MAG: hypothetical protein H6557_15395 [Lewinellaceae bacterium]|nr:hypothetical protein [Phaeodactylibacter sp.]MCB9038000.1 hypothetical protein [Lewinellaceae bacterium]
MKAAAFVKKVKALKPSRSVLANKELPDALIDELLSSYEILPKKERRTCSSELMELTDNYNMKGFEVLGITFQAQTSQQDSYITFATMELDELTIDVQDGMVQLLSFETGEVLYACAVDSEHFLDVLYKMVKIVAHRIKYDHFSDPCTDAVRLAELSGLPESIGFYRWVLGCEGAVSLVRGAVGDSQER